MRDDYGNYSVTGLEMALAHFRFPHAAECFFFLRQRNFLDSPDWKSVPYSARSAFEEPKKSTDASDPKTAHKEEFSTQYLRDLVQRKGGIRVCSYSPCLSSQPYTFSSHLVITKVKELWKGIQKPEEDAEKLKKLKTELLTWWKLLEEQKSNKWKAHIAESAIIADLGSSEKRGVQEDGRAAGIEKGGGNDGDANEEGVQENDNDAKDAKPDQKQDENLKQDAVKQILEFIKEYEPRIKEMQEDKELKQPSVGNTNVAAHGVSLSLRSMSKLTLGVLLNLREVVDACYPEPTCMPDNTHLAEQYAQSRYIEELSASFVCLKDGSRLKALTSVFFKCFFTQFPACINTYVTFEEMCAGNSTTCCILAWVRISSPSLYCAAKRIQAGRHCLHAFFTTTFSSIAATSSSIEITDTILTARLPRESDPMHLISLRGLW
jgi:hypothetical protein